jgi:hypothetical protein
MAAVPAGLRFVAAADAAQLTPAEQAECLQMMERADAIRTAARNKDKTKLIHSHSPPVRPG